MNRDAQFSRRRLMAYAGAGTVSAAALTVAGPGSTTRAAAAQRIIPRSEWGFNGWVLGGPPAMNHSAITRFIVHYHGASGANINGVQAPRNVHEIGKYGPDNGSGIRYNFVITQAGEIFAGRGFDFQSGATSGVNVESISVQMHIHGSTAPSSAGKSALEWLYRRCHVRLDATLQGALWVTGHGDHGATACPGGPLNAWVDGRGQQLYAELSGQYGPGVGGVPPYPGADAFQIGKSHPAVKTLDGGLIRKGYTQHHDGNGYQAGPVFSEYTRLNVRDFQLDQGWTGSGADGYPGPETWKRLLS